MLARSPAPENVVPGPMCGAVVNMGDCRAAAASMDIACAWGAPIGIKPRMPSYGGIGIGHERPLAPGLPYNPPVNPAADMGSGVAAAGGPAGCAGAISAEA